MAQENPTWGYDRIVGALANVGHHLSDRTVGNILRRQGISPAPQRKQTTRGRDFIRAHRDVLVGTDFFTVDVLTLKGLVTYYVLFFLHLESRRVCVAGLTPYPDQQWMEQQARNVTMKDWGFLAQSRYLLHDRDGKFCPAFREVIRAAAHSDVSIHRPQCTAHSAPKPAEHRFLCVREYGIQCWLSPAQGPSLLFFLYFECRCADLRIDFSRAAKYHLVRYEHRTSRRNFDERFPVLDADGALARLQDLEDFDFRPVALFH